MFPFLNRSPKSLTPPESTPPSEYTAPFEQLLKGVLDEDWTDPQIVEFVMQGGKRAAWGAWLDQQTWPGDSQRGTRLVLLADRLRRLGLTELWQPLEQAGRSLVLADATRNVVREDISPADTFDFELVLQEVSQLLELEQIQAAVDALDHALEITPTEERLWIIRGDILWLFTQQLAAALTAYDQALAINPDRYEVWANRGILLGDLGRSADATASYNQALAIKPGYYEAWYKRGLTLMRAGQPKAAIAAYNRALEIQPDAAEVLQERKMAMAQLSSEFRVQGSDI